MRVARSFLVLAAWMLMASAVSAATTTQVRLVLSADTARPGETVWAGVHLKMAPGWHTYWRNGGDAGGPTKVDWTLPAGVRARDLQWPVPEKLVTGPVTTYVYNDAVTLLIPLTLASNLASGSLELKARISWLECDELCLSGKTNVSANLTIGNEAKSSAGSALITEAITKLPGTNANLPVRARWETLGNAETRPVIIDWEIPEKSAVVDFYPYASDAWEVQAPTDRLSDDGTQVRLRKLVKKFEGDWPKQLPGILVRRAAENNSPQVYEVNLPVAAPPKAAQPFPGFGALLGMLSFAFLGGLILNVMPCVLPVIALKILGFVNQAKEEPKRVRELGLIYGAGVLVSFLALAGLAIAVQRAGGLAGWGMAFQNPQFRVLITVLITLVALNLFGVFEVTLSGQAMDAAGHLVSKQGNAGAFFNGVLATVLATPCTAPFLGIAIGFAFTQSPLVIVLIFLASGLGLAFPFVLLCWQPAWLKFLPKPGVWMERFKVAMGFPMLATAVWLFWVAATRMGKTGVLWFGLFLVMVALAAWIWGEFVQRSTRRRAWAVAVSGLIAITAYGVILEGELHWRTPMAAAQDAIHWQPWSPQAVEQARREQHPVLVDFTADTCLNCQLNKITSLETGATRAKLKAINAVALIGDYTDENPAIGQELQRFGRPGVPLVLVYPKDPSKSPIVLPPVLTPKLVLDALDKAAQ